MLLKTLAGFADEQQKLFLWNANDSDAVPLCFHAQDIGRLICWNKESLRQLLLM